MVKKLDAVDSTIDLDITKSGIRNIWFDGTYYFIADVVLGTGKIYRYNSSWGSKTEVWSGTIFKQATNQVSAIPSIGYVNSTYYVLFSTTSGDGALSYNNMAVRVVSSTAGGGAATWTATTIIDSAPGIAPVINQIQILGISTTPYLAIIGGASGSSKSGLAMTDIDGVPLHVLTSTGQYTGCFSDGTYIWFLHWLAANTYAIYKWSAAGGFVSDSTPTLTGGSNINMDYAQYWRVGPAQYIIWKDIFYYWLNTTDGWKLVPNLDSDNPIPHWSLDGTTLEINAVTYGNRYIEVFGSQIGMYALSTTLVPKFAWDTYVGEATNLYQITTVSDTTIFGKGTYKIETYPTADLDYPIEPFEDQAIKLYDSNDTQLIRGSMTISNDDNIAPYIITVESFAKIDLSKPITYSGTNKTLDEAITAILPLNCDYIIKGTFSTSATPRDYSCIDIQLQDLLTDWCHADGKIWYLDGEDQLYIDAGAEDSTKDVLSASGVFCDIKPARLLKKVGTVEVWGQDGAYYKKSSNTSNGYVSDIKYSMPQAQIEEWANSVLTNTSVKVQQYILGNVNVGFFIIGQQITLEQNFAPYNITSDQYYTKEGVFDYVTEQWDKIIVHDVLHYSVEAMELSVEKVEDHVTYVENRIGEVIETEVVKVDSSISSTVDDYKRAGALEWGSSGDPTIGSIVEQTNCDVSIQSNYLDHNYPLEISDQDASYYGRWYYDFGATSTPQYFSCWVSVDTAAKSTYLSITANASGFTTANLSLFLIFESDNNIKIYNGATLTTIMAYSPATWYHIESYLDCSTDTYTLFIDGTYINTYAFRTVLSEIQFVTFSTVAGTTGYKSYLDAVYIGTDYKAAWGSLYPDPILSRQLIAEDGFRHVDRFTDQEVAGVKTFSDYILLSTPSAFCVDKNDAQAIPTADDTKIAFDDEDYDDNSEYDAATNYRFTCKRAGLYHFDTSVLLAASAWTAGQYTWIAFYKGGSNYRVVDSFEIEANGTFEVQLSGSMDIKLAINDYIEVWVYHTRGADTNTSASALYNYFNGHRVIG